MTKHVKVYSREEFLLWCEEQGEREFNPRKPECCAVTQFGQAKERKDK